MKLAEALILRADLQKRIEQIHQRIVDNAQVQEGDKPAEDPSKLIGELEKNSQELVTLIQRINRTNSATMVEENLTMADVLAERDALKKRQSIYREVARAGQIKSNRFSRSEVKFISTVDVQANQKKADSLAKAHRELDARIQALNWATELS